MKKFDELIDDTNELHKRVEFCLDCIFEGITKKSQLNDYIKLTDEQYSLLTTYAYALDYAKKFGYDLQFKRYPSKFLGDEYYIRFVVIK